MWTPSSRATGLSVASFSSDVSRRPSSRATRVGGAGRLAVVVEVGGVDGDDLAVEAALGPRPGRPLLGEQAERVGVLAGDAPLLGDALGALELGRELVLAEVGLRDRAAELASWAFEPIGTRLMTSTPQARATSTTPEPTRPVATFVACWDDPHWVSTVVGGDRRAAGRR